MLTNWIIGLCFLSIMAVKLLWGSDIIIVAHLQRRERWHHVFLDGSLWLGWYFVLSGIFLYGALGFLLLQNPYQAVPLWFAVPCVTFTIDCIGAWVLLGRLEPEDA